MINQLKQHYAHAISSSSLPSNKQFILSFQENEHIILDKSLLNEQELALLRTLFHVVEDTPNVHNEKDRHFYEFLIDDKEFETNNIITFPVRCIHFSIHGEIEDRNDFSEALKGLFSASLSFIWKSPTEGILLQQIDSQFEENILVESIVDTLTTDFFVKISLYIGSPVSDAPSLKKQYKWESEAYALVKKQYPSISYFKEQDVTTYVLLNEASSETIRFILTMLDPVKDDRSLLSSVKTYLECNMNTTLAAKKMFMHRNTLQYRVDKFIEKTAIDIKQFPNAVAVYFMLLLFDSLKND